MQEKETGYEGLKQEYIHLVEQISKKYKNLQILNESITKTLTAMGTISNRKYHQSDVWDSKLPLLGFASTYTEKETMGIDRISVLHKLARHDIARLEYVLDRIQTLTELQEKYQKAYHSLKEKHTSEALIPMDKSYVEFYYTEYMMISMDEISIEIPNRFDLELSWDKKAEYDRNHPEERFRGPFCLGIQYASPPKGRTLSYSLEEIQEIYKQEKDRQCSIGLTSEDIESLDIPSKTICPLCKRPVSECGSLFPHNLVPYYADNDYFYSCENSPYVGENPDAKIKLPHKIFMGICSDCNRIWRDVMSDCEKFPNWQDYSYYLSQGSFYGKESEIQEEKEKLIKHISETCKQQLKNPDPPKPKTEIKKSVPLFENKWDRIYSLLYQTIYRWWYPRVQYWMYPHKRHHTFHEIKQKIPKAMFERAWAGAPTEKDAFRQLNHYFQKLIYQVEKKPELPEIRLDIDLLDFKLEKHLTQALQPHADLIFDLTCKSYLNYLIYLEYDKQFWEICVKFRKTMQSETDYYKKWNEYVGLYLKFPMTDVVTIPIVVEKNQYHKKHTIYELYRLAGLGVVSIKDWFHYFLKENPTCSKKPRPELEDDWPFIPLKIK